MILNINEDISKEVTDKIATALNELKPSDKLFIYLSSSGGETDAIEAIVHIINNNVDIIELVGYGELKSAAFEIFFKAMCHKMILKTTLGMYHQCNTTVNVNENGAPFSTFDQANKAWTKGLRDHTIDFCKKLQMTEKEIASIKQGKDVYFQPKRMQELLKSSQLHANNI